MMVHQINISKILRRKIVRLISIGEYNICGWINTGGVPMPDTKCQEEYLRRIHKVQDYIEEHIGQPLSIEELSRAAGFSKYHFSRIFQGILREPLAHYVNRIRMERALFYLGISMALVQESIGRNIARIAKILFYCPSTIKAQQEKNGKAIYFR